MLKVELLDLTHDRTGFQCGVELLDLYLRQVARQHIEKGISKTFVMVDESSTAPKPVLGFFTISLCQVIGNDIPAKWAKKLPQQIPAMKLCRLAVASGRQGQGIGKCLVVAALQKVAAVDKIAGGIGLFVDAKDEGAAAFYAKFGFEATPSAELALFMPMSTVQQFSETGACDK